MNITDNIISECHICGTKILQADFRAFVLIKFIDQNPVFYQNKCDPDIWKY